MLLVVYFEEEEIIYSVMRDEIHPFFLQVTCCQVFSTKYLFS